MLATYSIRELGYNTYSIEKRAEDIQKTFEQDPTQTHPLVKTFVAISPQSVADGKHAGYTEAHEHHGPVWPPSRRSEELDPADYTAACAKDKDLPKLHISKGYTLEAVSLEHSLRTYTPSSAPVGRTARSRGRGRSSQQ